MTLDKETLAHYISDSFGVDSAELHEDAALFSTGLLDSFCLVNLISFVEKQAAIRISPIDVNLDNFDTVENILALVERRKI